MTAEVCSTDLPDEIQDVLRFSLCAGMWDGREISYTEAPEFFQDLQTRIFSALEESQYELSDTPYLDSLAARFAMIGTPKEGHDLLSHDIGQLLISQDGQIVQVGFGKSVKKFWKKHKTEIIVGTVIAIAVVTIVVVAANLGTAAAAKQGAGLGLGALGDKINSDNDAKRKQSEAKNTPKPSSPPSDGPLLSDDSPPSNSPSPSIPVLLQFVALHAEPDYKKAYEERLEATKVMSLTSHEIRMDTVQALKEEFGLEFYGFVSDIEREVTHQTLILDYPGALRKEDAKKMVERASKFYLEKINANQVIQRYLIESPFTEKHVEVVIRGSKEGEILEVSLGEKGISYIVHSKLLEK